MYETTPRALSNQRPDFSQLEHIRHEVAAGTGLSYGHAFATARPSLIATLPVGYGDGLRRNLSNQMEVLIGGSGTPGGRISGALSMMPPGCSAGKRA